MLIQYINSNPPNGHLKQVLIANSNLSNAVKEVLVSYSMPNGTANQIAEKADFFSFGTNDLTQTTFGFSRDDIGSFIQDYFDNNILREDPFKTIDQEGVGQLVKIAVKKAKQSKPKIKIGICGEHGGDPKSIYFFNDINLDYISCSPYRIPIAYLAAAKASIRT